MELSDLLNVKELPVVYRLMETSDVMGPTEMLAEGLIQNVHMLPETVVLDNQDRYELRRGPLGDGHFVTYYRFFKWVAVE